jgi:hypothetical protein
MENAMKSCVTRKISTPKSEYILLNRLILLINKLFFQIFTWTLIKGQSRADAVISVTDMDGITRAVMS